MDGVAVAVVDVDTGAHAGDLGEAQFDGVALALDGDTGRVEGKVPVGDVVAGAGDGEAIDEDAGCGDLDGGAAATDGPDDGRDIDTGAEDLDAGLVGGDVFIVGTGGDVDRTADGDGVDAALDGLLGRGGRAAVEGVVAGSGVDVADGGAGRGVLEVEDGGAGSGTEGEGVDVLGVAVGIGLADAEADEGVSDADADAGVVGENLRPGLGRASRLERDGPSVPGIGPLRGAATDRIPVLPRILHDGAIGGRNEDEAALPRVTAVEVDVEVEVGGARGGAAVAR